MPFDFVRFGLITLAGILLFGERYDLFTLAGGAVILLSTIILALREQALAQEERKRPPS
jgi:drug/metabolite transporter (DMT)-like permease